MKKHVLISLTLLALLSGKAAAHQIYFSDCDDSAEAQATAQESEAFDTFDQESEDLTPIQKGVMTGIAGLSGYKKSPDEPDKCYSDSPESQDLREAQPDAPESDRLVAMNFCKMGGYANPVDCASDLLEKNLVNEAKGCLDIASDVHKDISVIAHQIGSSSSGKGYWHTDYRYSKEEGMHRHDWTPEMREKAGRMYAVEQVEIERKLRSRQGITDSSKVGTGDTAAIDGKVGIDGTGIGSSTEKTKTSERATTTQTGPLTQTEIDKLVDKYEKMGVADPNVVDLTPNIMCMRNEKTCSSSTSKVIPNTSYQPDSGKKSDDSGRDSKNADGSTSKKTSDNASEAPKSSSRSPSDKSTDHSSDRGTWAGEPTGTPGEVWASFTQEAPENDPMASCLFDAYKEKVKSETQKNYREQGEDPRSDAEKKRDAEAALKKGFCNAEYFGKGYCDDWQKKRELIKSSGSLSDEKLQGPAIEHDNKPGLLHYSEPEPQALDPELFKKFQSEDLLKPKGLKGPKEPKLPGGLKFGS